MTRANAELERWVVEQAEPRDGADVLVIGHGPGLGIAAAAAAVAPTGHVVAVDPSGTMRDMAAARCASLIRDARVDVRDGTPEATGCPDGSVDLAISVNNVMLWDRPWGSQSCSASCVLRPGGRLVLSVHRHILDVDPNQLVDDAQTAGFTDVKLSLRARRFPSPAVELLARRPEH